MRRSGEIKDNLSSAQKRAVSPALSAWWNGLSFLLVFLSVSSVFSQTSGEIKGFITDNLGGYIVQSKITLTESEGKSLTAVSGKSGQFSFKNLSPGRYSLRVEAEKFVSFEKSEIQISGGETLDLQIALTIAPVETVVEIANDREVKLDADSNASAIVLDEKAIEDLPDDPEELEEYLRTLAGGGMGIEGGQIYLDGVSGGRLPPKSSIREIRINRSPFSAEHERPGYGGIEIITNPGSEKFRGQSNFSFNDARLNSRNPFALSRPPSQSRNFGGSFSGPLRKKVSSFFLDFNSNQQDNNRLTNASVIDAGFNVVPFREEISVPSRSSTLSARFDYLLNKNNTLMGRYSRHSNRSENQGVGDLALPSRGFANVGKSHDLHITEAMILGPSIVNESIFAYSINRREQTGDNSVPTINVSGGFVGGGSQVGLNYSNTSRLEFQNNTTMSVGKNGRHSIKFGVRIRNLSIEDRSESNFGGTFTFSGVRDPATGTLLFSSIDQYRQKILGNTDTRFNPNQFSITDGDALASVSQTDFSFFVTDEWNVHKSFSVSLGLRYENQTNVSDHNDFAPRAGFAFAPGNVKKGQSAKTVLRGGIGFFYDRLSESFFLQARRFDGTKQTQYIVSSNPDILSQPVFSLNGVTNVPTISGLSAFARQGTLTTRRIANDLSSPRSFQAALSLDRQLPKKTRAAITYRYSKGVSHLGIRNINAPLCPPLSSCTSTSPRPIPEQGNIYQYESIGDVDQQQIVVTLNSNAFKGMSLNANYRFGYLKSNVDGFGSFPSYSYDLGADYSAASNDIRHSLSLNGSYELPFRFRISPSFSYNSGRPFNITTGADTNRDSIFNDRPTYAQLSAICAARALNAAFCSFQSPDQPDQAIIPRNFGRTPSNVTLDLRLNKSFVFTKEKSRTYNLVVGLNARNVLNRTNAGAPIGNMSSNRFGQVFSTMGNGFGGTANRRIELNVRFNF